MYNLPQNDPICPFFQFIGNIGHFWILLGKVGPRPKWPNFSNLLGILGILGKLIQISPNGPIFSILLGILGILGLLGKYWGKWKPTRNGPIFSIYWEYWALSENIGGNGAPAQMTQFSRLNWDINDNCPKCAAAPKWHNSPNAFGMFATICDFLAKGLQPRRFVVAEVIRKLSTFTAEKSRGTKLGTYTYSPK